MRRNQEIEQIADDAQQCQRYFFGVTANQKRSMRKRWLAHEYVRLYPNVYARSEYYNKLNPRERALHLIRALAAKYPQKVFGAMSAALILGLECPGYNDRLGHVQIAADTSIPPRPSGTIEKIYVHPLTFIVHDGIRITPPERTLVDCGLRYSYMQSLGIFDSALRFGMTTRKDIADTCSGLRKDCSPIQKLLRDADEKSENGGESLCRATILEAGLARPELQHEFRDPANRKHIFRTDFLWTCDHKTVVLEYDGMEKYTNQHMTNGHDTRRVVYDERNREDALRRAGVTAILRTDYEELRRPQTLIQKLLNNGVPMGKALW
ncbi:hypothetical protein [Bifidobacterium sp. ESL0704]|uniref:hypothetical protein n=1 Tax=Bifidobacterium sp. ESL0704 TaxID=2983219 RepID=UPI0023FA0B42|nr:hypothetical protein [Bifidobacterium sp. ESL0704]WEV52993.1 hypothetical protein OZX64_00325 [Bifidobacterium sp. ESL0704]